MSKYEQKTLLTDKISQALRNHARDETNYGQDFAGLPPGIIGGVAQLVEAKIGVYKKGRNEGEKYIRLAGVVVEPVEVNVVRRVFRDGKVVNLPMETVRVKGLQTSKILPLGETQNSRGEFVSVDDNVAVALNELRMLGGRDFTASLENAPDLMAELESLLEVLKTAAPYFKFNTRGSTPTKDYPNERTWEDWRGAIADYVPDESNVSVQDKTKDEEEKEQRNANEEPVEMDDLIGAELDDLSDTADRNDPNDEECIAAQDRLQEIARQRGIDPDARNKRGEQIYPTWTSLVRAIRSAKKQNLNPVKGEVYNCKFPGTRKSVEVEIVDVNTSKCTVDVKRLDSGNVVKDVLWSFLEQ